MTSYRLLQLISWDLYKKIS